MHSPSHKSTLANVLSESPSTEVKPRPLRIVNHVTPMARQFARMRDVRDMTVTVASMDKWTKNTVMT